MYYNLTVRKTNKIYSATVLRRDRSQIMRKINSICITAVFTALVFVATAFVQIPIPLGYANLGDCIIIYTALMCGPGAGVFAGAIGAALADIMTGYPMWAVFTLIIKAVIALLAAYITGKSEKKNKIRMFIGAVVSMVFMAAAYTLSGMLLYGSVASGLASAPGLIAEGVVNIVVFYILYYTLGRTGFSRRLMEFFNGAQ